MPEVVAHRGASEDVPEHTLAAYVRAIEDGADALECDVRLTADGHLVCVHDRRIDRTSNGTGIVSTKTLAELRDHDFASWVAAEHDDPPVLDTEERSVLTLARLLELVVDGGREVGLAIETKHPTRYAGLVEERTVALLRRFGLATPRVTPRGTSSVRMMSFSQLSVRRVRVLAPGLPAVMLLDRTPLRMREGWLPFGARIAGPSIDIVRAHPGYVAKVHARGHQVHVWTVDDLGDIDLCNELGVDAIITNRPAKVLAHLGRSPSRPDRATPSV